MCPVELSLAKVAVVEGWEISQQSSTRPRCGAQTQPLVSGAESSSRPGESVVCVAVE